MAKAKKKTAKKATGKAAKKKTIVKRKTTAKARTKSSKPAVKKRAVKKSARRGAANDGVQLGVSFELDNRLRELATKMDKSLEEILIQALTEFADNWEDHMRTVSALNDGDDRMQLVVPKDDNA